MKKKQFISTVFFICNKQYDNKIKFYWYKKLFVVL